MSLISFKLVAFSLGMSSARGGGKRILVREIGVLLTKLVEIQHELVDGILHMHVSYTRPKSVLLIQYCRFLLDTSCSTELVSVYLSVDVFRKRRNL